VENGNTSNDTMFLKKGKLIVFLLIGFIAFSLIIAFIWRRTAEKPVEEMPAERKLKIVTTIYPLYLLAQGAGGQLIEVENLIPLPRYPWNVYDLVITEREKQMMDKTDVLIRTSTSIDRWAEGLPKQYPHVQELVLGGEMRLLPSLPPVAGGESGTEDDPYFWLDPGRMMVAVGQVRDMFIEQEPSKRQVYWAQASAYVEMLSMIDRDFHERFRGVQSKRIAASSSFMTYFVNSFGLEWVGAGAGRLGEQPTQAQLDNLRRAMRRNGVNALFVAPNDGWAKDFAAREGLTVYQFDPMEFASGGEVNYDTVMRENMRVMSQALGYVPELE